MKIYENYKSTLVENSKAVNNIGSGKKLNSAKDNPNKIAQSENLKINLKSRDAASQNIQDTNSMLQTFDGALQEMNNDVARLKQLTVSAANGTNIDEDKAVIQKEIDNIKNNLDYLAKNTSFNGISMSSTTITSKKSTIGALSNENIDIPFFDLSNVGIGVDGIDVTDPSKLNSNIDAVDKANVTISMIRSKYGAIQSRLSDTYDELDEMNQPLYKAQSSIEDADIAEESLENSRTKILYESALSLMVQSNKLPQNALNVLSSVR
jgi:flagellin